jgi:hypothetical protein
MRVSVIEWLAVGVSAMRTARNRRNEATEGAYWIADCGVGIAKLLRGGLGSSHHLGWQNEATAIGWDAKAALVP